MINADPKIHFGKHKDKKIKNLPRGYKMWLLEQSWVSFETKKEVQVTLSKLDKIN